jgi:hypothetical protein
LGQGHHIFTRVALVRTYNAGLSFCCCCCSCRPINQNTALLFNFTMLSAYCTIALHPCHAPLPGSHSRQPFPAALRGSHSWQPCPAAIPGSLARQPFPAALPGNLVRLLCLAALPCSLARQPCPAALKKYYNFNN